MVKTNCWTDYSFIVSTTIFIVLLYLFFYFFDKNNCFNNCKNDSIDKEFIHYKLKNIEEKIENYQDNNKTIIKTVNYPTATIQENNKTLNSLDRIYNPLRYPYKSDYFYDQSWYPNLELPFQVIGCGSRNTPCLGGTQIPIYNTTVPIDVSNTNISPMTPINISTKGPLGRPQQVGILYKIYGDDNDVLPLFGRRKYPNDNIYDYYTIMGQYGVKIPIVTKNKKDELGTNDVVFIKGTGTPYRVTIYKSDFPEYIPYA